MMVMTALLRHHTSPGSRRAGLGSASVDGCRVTLETYELPAGGVVAVVLQGGLAVASGYSDELPNVFANALLAGSRARQDFHAKRRHADWDLERAQLLEMLMSCTSCTPELIEDLGRLASAYPEALYA